MARVGEPRAVSSAPRVRHGGEAVRPCVSPARTGLSSGGARGRSVPRCCRRSKTPSYGPSWSASPRPFKPTCWRRSSWSGSCSAIDDGGLRRSRSRARFVLAGAADWRLGPEGFGATLPFRALEECDIGLPVAQARDACRTSSPDAAFSPPNFGQPRPPNSRTHLSLRSDSPEGEAVIGFHHARLPERRHHSGAPWSRSRDSTRSAVSPKVSSGQHDRGASPVDRSTAPRLPRAGPRCRGR